MGFAPITAEKGGKVTEADSPKHDPDKKPSVLAELREAAKAPKEPHKDKPTKNRGWQEH